jgi:3-oxoadipate enol-lactonase
MPRLRANNVHLNYVEAGQGEPPLVLLHGVGGSHEMWQPVLPALSASRRVLAGDHRGHGGSDKPGGPYTVRLLADDWRAALGALGVQRADLLGLSLGGAVAMRLAADHPERVRKLVLVDTWGFPHPDFVGMMRERLALLERGDLRAYADAAIPQVYSDGYVREHPEAIEAYRARVARAEVASLRSAVGACVAHDMRGDLARVAAPTLVLVGRQDRLTPPYHSEYLARAIAGASLAVVDGCAHFPHLEAPETFLRMVGAFLQKG